MIQVLNGANLGRLGKREPDKYGTTTYAELVELIEQAAGELGQDVVAVRADQQRTVGAGEAGQVPDVDQVGDQDGVQPGLDGGGPQPVAPPGVVRAAHACAARYRRASTYPCTPSPAITPSATRET